MDNLHIIKISSSFVTVQSLSYVRLFETPWMAARQASLSFTISQSLLKHMSIQLVMPAKLLILYHPLLLLPSSFPSIRVLFYRVSSLYQVAKALELQFQHQYFQWIFRIDFLWDWFVLSPCSPRDSPEAPQHHTSKAPILQCSAFFMIQVPHPHMATGKP